MTVAPTPPYLTKQHLLDAWGVQVMSVIFDPQKTGKLDEAAINRLILRASRRTTAWFGNTYDGTLPFGPAAADIPEMVEELAYAYAWWLASFRAPDYFKAIDTKTADLEKNADALGGKLQAAILRMIDAKAPVPDNVGGDWEGTDPHRHFGKEIFFGSMGDF